MSPLHGKDPLEGLGDEGENFYILENQVFAEPIKANETCSEIETIDNNFIFLDKITVERRVGRRNKYHIDIEDTTKPKCPESACLKEFPSVNLLRTHIRRVHCAENNFVCDQCGARFSARYLLARHIMVHQEKVECPTCFKRLSKRTSLLVHNRAHSNTRPHKCTICGKCFVRKSTLNIHMKVHSLKCGRCKRGFESVSLLSEHSSVCEHQQQ